MSTSRKQPKKNDPAATESLPNQENQLEEKNKLSNTDTPVTDLSVVDTNKPLVNKDLSVVMQNTNTPSGDRTRLDGIKFLRHAVRLSPGVSKNDLRSAFKRNRNDWAERIGYANLIDSVAAGYIHQLEDEETGLKDIVCLDFDFYDKTTSAPIDNAITVEEICKIATVAKYGNFLQTSISFAPDHQNSHVYIILSRPVTAEESNRITKGLVEAIKRDLKATAKSPDSNLGIDACVANNSKQVIFASLANVVTINHDCIADVEELLQMSKEFDVKVAKGRKPAIAPKVEIPRSQSVMTPGEREIVPTRVTITDKVLEHLHDHLFVGKFDADPRKLYGMHGEKLQWSARATECDGEVLRVEGVNPFSATNNSGNSFMVIHEDGLLPRFWDKSGSFDAVHGDGYSSNQGTYLDYYFYVQQRFFDKFPGVKLGKDGSFPKGFFKVLVEDIITTHGLPEFDWNCLDIEFEELKDHLIDVFKGKIYYLGKDTYYFFSEGKWQVFPDYKVVNQYTVDPYMSENYADRTIYQIKGKKRTIIRHDSELFLEVIRRMAHKHEFRMSPQDMPTENFNYVPLQNGLYDIKKKELIENDGRAHNHHVLPWNYTPESVDLKVVKLLRLYLRELFCCDVAGDIVFNWILLNCQRRAFDTTKCLGIFGASGKGKTTVLMLISKLLNGFNSESEIPVNGYAVQPQKVGLTNNPHATADLEGRTSVLIQELGAESKENDILNFLKPFLGNKDNRVLHINQKFQPTRKVLHNIAFTYDCEKMPNIDAEVHGHFRRTVFIKMPDCSPGSDEFHNKYLNVIESNLEGIFNYALTLETKDLLDEFKQLSKSDVINAVVTEVRHENSPLLDFYRDYFEITNDETDTVSFDVAFECLEKVNNNGTYCAKSIKKRVFINKSHEMLKDPTMDLKWTGDRNEAPKHCQVSKRTRRGYFTGLRLSREGMIKFGLFDSSTDKDM